MEVYGHLAPGYLRAEVDRLAFGLTVIAPAEAPARVAIGAELAPFAAPLLRGGRTEDATAGNRTLDASDSRPLDWRAIQDSNLWPSAPEADALSS